MKYLRITVKDPEGGQLLKVVAQVPSTYSPVNAALCTTLQVEYLADLPPAMPREAYPGEPHPEGFPWYPLNFRREGEQISHEGQTFHLAPNGLFYEVDKFR